MLFLLYINRKICKTVSLKSYLCFGTGYEMLKSNRVERAIINCFCILFFIFFFTKHYATTTASMYNPKKQNKNKIQR